MEKLIKQSHEDTAVYLSLCSDDYLLTLLDGIKPDDFLPLAIMGLRYDKESQEAQQMVEREIVKALPEILLREVAKRWRCIKENKELIPGEPRETLTR